MMKNPVRRSAALALILLLLASMCLWAESVPTTQDLDVLMLFTDEDRKNDSGTLSKNLYNYEQAQVLTAAVYLCVDATNDKVNKRSNSYTTIENYIRKQLKYKSDDIVFKGDAGGSHEKYTHKGWHYYDYQLTDKDLLTDKYQLTDNDDKNQKTATVCWYKRRYILQLAVNKLFKFNPIDEWISLKQCEILLKCAENGKSISKRNIIKRAFILSDGDFRDTKSGSLAAIFYYTHILGDIIDNQEGSAGTRMSIDGVQKELEKHLYNLFGKSAVEEQVDLYVNLTNRLHPYEPKNQGKSDDYIRYVCEPALDLLQSLQKNLGTLLENKTFYTESELYKPAKQVNSISPPLPKVAAIFVQWREKAVNACPPSPLIPLRRRYALA